MDSLSSSLNSSLLNKLQSNETSASQVIMSVELLSQANPSFLFSHWLNRILLACFFITVVLNLFYIFVVRRNQETVTEHIFLNLILSGVNAVTSAINIVYACQAFFPADERFSISSAGVIAATSWQSLILIEISTERFIAVLKPLHYPLWVTRPRLLAGVALSGLFALLLGVIVMFLPKPTFASLLELDVVITVGDVLGKALTRALRLWVTYQIVLSILVIALTIPVLVTIHKQSQNISSKTSMRGMLILTAVMLYFSIAWLPMATFAAAEWFIKMPIMEYWTDFNIQFSLAVLALVSGPLVTPLLYEYSNKSFWTQMKSLYTNSNAVRPF